MCYNIITVSVEVYTDGSCRNTTGGCAYIIRYNNIEISRQYYKFLNTTNNQMELKAIILSLEKLLELDFINHNICIFSDSEYSVLGITKWINTWQKNNWTGSHGGMVKNQEYWQHLHKLVNLFNKLQFQWIRAHNNHIYNDEVDKLARLAINN